MKVLFVDTVHEYLEQKLKEHKFTCDHFNSKNVDEFLYILPNYDGLVIRSKFVLSKEVLSNAIKLKFIARAGAGMENIDVEFAHSKNIVCFNSPEGNRDAVGEHALAMLLMLLNKLKKADEEVRKGIWLRAENRSTELMGKTVGIIGYGNTGSRFAKKIAGFDVKILIHDILPKSTTIENAWIVSLEKIYQEADIVSLHIPLNNDTYHYFNDAFVQNMQKPFYVINTARGQNLNTVALVKGLESGKVLGACIDVLEYESSSFENLNKEELPEPFQYLIKSEKVILTPHIAGWSHESNYKMSYYLAEKILSLNHK